MHNRQSQQHNKLKLNAMSRFCSFLCVYACMYVCCTSVFIATYTAGICFKCIRVVTA